MVDIQEMLSVADFCLRYSIGKTSLYREAAKPGSLLKLRKYGTATRIARRDAEAWAASLPVIDKGAAQ